MTPPVSGPEGTAMRTMAAPASAPAEAPVKRRRAPRKKAAPKLEAA